MLSYDFIARAAPRLSDRARVRLGRGLMVGILGLCAAVAPGIRQFQGVFAYLVQLWSLLAPPVFVCVVAGIFTRRASARGATATLVTGTVLGAVAFWALADAEIAAQLPRYLRSPLNCGFAITVICALAMALGSAGRGAASETREYALARTGTGEPTMTAGERRIFRGVLAVLVAVWLGVIVTFSPWGVAGPRPQPPPAAKPVIP
jgi:Na+/proline symporter